MVSVMGDGAAAILIAHHFLDKQIIVNGNL